jgi:hypothetical protein
MVEVGSKLAADCPGDVLRLSVRPEIDRAGIWAGVSVEANPCGGRLHVARDRLLYSILQRRLTNPSTRSVREFH